MGKFLNIIWSLLAYVCIASVITIALSLGYLWQTDRLNDDKMFRIMALLHDVDLDQLAAANSKTDDEIPPEEPSLHDVLHRQQVQDRNFEVKLLALQRGRQEYDDRLHELKELRDRYDRQAQDWQNKLKQQEQLTTQENVAKVVSQLEQVKPKTGKESLMRWIDEGRMDDAILLMSKMSETKLSKILKTFETDEELDKLHELHRRIIGGSGDGTNLKEVLNELDTLKDKS